MPNIEQPLSHPCEVRADNELRQPEALHMSCQAKVEKRNSEPGQTRSLRVVYGAGQRIKIRAPVQRYACDCVCRRQVLWLAMAVVNDKSRVQPGRSSAEFILCSIQSRALRLTEPATGNHLQIMNESLR